MASPAAVLSILVTANTSHATRGIMRLNTQLGATESSAHKALGAVKTMAKGAAIGTGIGLGYAVKKAADFEQQLDSLGSVSGATGREMEKLRRQAMKAGADTKFSALDAARAQTELAKGGASVAQIAKGGLRSALALAAAGELDLALAAETSANAMNLFRLEGKDAMKVADQLATAANATTADVEDFAVALKMGGSVAKMAGLSFGETVLALEALAKIGIRNSDAGTSLKTAIIQLLKPTKKQAELAEELGLKFIDAEGNMKSMADISATLRDKLGGMTAAQRTATLATLAGTDGVRTLSALYDAGPAKLDRWAKGLDKSGTAARVAAEKQDNLKGKLENLQGSIETIAIAIGSKMLPSLTKAAEKVTDILNDPKLTASEKLQKLGNMVAAAIESGLEKAVEMARQIAPRVASAFAQGWWNAGIWTKLVVGGWLLSKFGGIKAFAALGQLVGRAFGVNIAMGAATAAAGTGGAAGGAAAGGMLGMMRGKILPFAKRAGLAGVGIALADSVISEFGRRSAEKGPDMWKALAAAQGPKPLGVDIFGAGGVTDFFLKDSEKAARGLAPVLREIAAGSREISPEKAAALHREIQKLGDLAPGVRDQFHNVVTNSRTMSTGVAANIRALKEGTGTDFKRMAQLSKDNMGLIRAAMDENSKVGKEKVQASFQAASGAITDAMSKGKVSVKTGMKLIKEQARIHSDGSRESIAKNFARAREAIKDSMRRSGKITEKGMKAIYDLVVAELALYGMSPKDALKNLDKVPRLKDLSTPVRPQTKSQRGGIINMGAPSGDSVPALLERDEYVLNRRAVRKVGKKNLDRLNFLAAPRFQGGGMIDPAWDPGNERLAASISGKVGSWAKRYQANMTAGYDPGGGHVSPGHNVTGTATDMVPLAGNWDLLEKGLRVLVGTGLKVLYGSNGIGMSWPNHGRGNHAHIEWGGAGGLPSFDPKLARVIVAGPDSPLKSVVQGALDRTRAAAQKRLRNVIGASFLNGTGGVSAGGAFDKPALRSLWVRANNELGDPNLMAAIALAESGGDPNARNPSGASGLWQILGLPFPGDPFDPMTNARMAGSKLLSQGLGAWEAYTNGNYTKFMQRGGIVASMRKGGMPLSRRLNRAVNIVGGLNQKGKRFPAKRRSKALHGFLDRIKKIDLPPNLQKNLSRFQKDVDIFGDMAERAGQLTVDGADGTSIQGVVGGLTEGEWLTKQLEALFKLRNALIRAEKVVAEKRERIVKLVEQAQKRLKTLAGHIRTYGKVKRGLEKQLKEAQKHPKRNRELIKELKGKIKDVDRDQGVRTRERGVLKNRILPALTGRRDMFGASLRDDIRPGIEAVQGLGSPMEVLKTLPEIGVLGGDIFGVQIRLRDLNEKPVIKDSTTDVPGAAEALELSRQSFLRTAVYDLQKNVFQQFATGGIVQGVRGAAVPAVVHGGEGVFTREQMAAMGGANVQVVVNGDIVNVPRGKKAIEVRDVRARNRVLPGRGGG